MLGGAEDGGRCRRESPDADGRIEALAATTPSPLLHMLQTILSKDVADEADLTLNVALRNQYLHDAVEWTVRNEPWNPAELEWKSYDPDELRKLSERIRADSIPENLHQQLLKAINRAAAETFTTYEQFMAAPMPAFEGLDGFLQWFYRNLPYAGLGLAKSPYLNWRSECGRRLDAMIERGRSQGVTDADRYVLMRNALDILSDF